VTLGHDGIPERIAYAREPRKLQVVLSADEVVRFLEAIPRLKSRTALTTVFAAGLRVSEVVMLKITDIDSQRMVIRVEQGKRPYDAELHKERNVIERFFNKLKQFRRVATRYDKLLVNFMGFVKLAAIAIWLR
jgi:transposase